MLTGRTLRCWPPAAKTAFGLAVCLSVGALTTPALALQLGEPSVSSALGQPLQMTVPVVLDTGAQLAPECVQIVRAEDNAGAAPSLSSGRVTLDPSGRQLTIESSQPIGEPALRVAVEVGCNQKIRREFSILLDPPSVVQPAASTVSSLRLGMAQISAVLGQPLSIKVPVVGADAGSLTASCVRLADPISSEGAPVLTQAQIRVLPQGATSVIEVLTPDAVTEPAVRIALDVGCTDPVRREFAVLLGLPTLAVSNAPELEQGAPAPQAEVKPKAKPKPRPFEPLARRAPKPNQVPPAAEIAAAPVQEHPSPAPAPAKEAVKAARPPSDRLVLASPEDIGPAAPSGQETTGAVPDATAELLKRIDAMTQQVQELQAQLNAERRRQEELRREFEERQAWTWSAGGLGGLLLGGALVMAWRQRRSPASSAWPAPVEDRLAAPIAPAIAREASVNAIRAARAAAGRDSRGIGGRATMPGALTNPPVVASTTPGATEPSEHNTHITVTELHDTVQIIKELYATVLERTTSGSASTTTTGVPSRPLELDLRTPEAAKPAVLGALAPALSARIAAGQAVPSGRDSRRAALEEATTEERFTELPTEVALDLDVGTRSAANEPTEPMLVFEPLPAAGTESRPMPAKDIGAERIPATTAKAEMTPAVPAPGALEERLTQTPTEVLIDIDVGPTTGLSGITSAAEPTRVDPAEGAVAQRPRGNGTASGPIDLKLDLPARPKAGPFGRS